MKADTFIVVYDFKGNLPRPVKEEYVGRIDLLHRLWCQFLLGTDKYPTPRVLGDHLVVDPEVP